MKIYNTLSREKENFKPLRFPDVKVYQCGPTVYNFAHIGNLKTSIVEDVIVRTLKFLGYKVVTTMNLTDIDDKTIRDSQKAGEGLKDFTQKYTKYFLRDLELLNCELPENITPISDIIPEMVRMIQTLLNKGFAYLADDGSIYYSIEKFKNYGQLAHLDVSGMKASVRIDNDEYEKESVADFVLWKAWKKEDGANAWEKEFEIPALTPTLSQGEREQKQKVVIKGRPGWHIECSACAMKYFGTQIDIHMGGEDLVFPHHQNEIAQSEACSGKTFSKYWIHSGHMLVDGKKMSKSLGNFYTLRDIEKKYGIKETPLDFPNNSLNSLLERDMKNSPRQIIHRALRFGCINGKYRDQIDFSFEKLEQNIATLKNIDEVCKKVSRYDTELSGVRRDFREYMQDIMARHIEALEDDFSFPESFAVFFEFVKYIREQIAAEEFSQEELQSCIDMLLSFDQVYGILDLSLFEEEEDIPEEIITLASQRQEAKDAKNYTRADEIRNELTLLGYVVKDTKEGSIVERI